MKGLIVIVAILAQFANASVSHDNEQVWRVFASKDKKPIIQAMVDNFGLDVWSAGFDHIDILVTPQINSLVKAQLKKSKLSHNIMIMNIQKIIDDQEFNRLKRTIKPLDTKLTSIDLEKYHSFEEINAYIDNLATNVDFVSVQTIGQTGEGRDMRMVKLSTQRNNGNASFIQCGIHAREWITPATCLYGLNHLTQNYGKDKTVTNYLDSQDIYMVVVVNPDGYSYSWTDDRMWRKNRVRTSNLFCPGIDLNRNYGGGGFGGAGSSSDPCSQTYRGVSEFSELETSSLRDAITNIQSSQRVKSYYDVHSYSQLWLHPYGYKSAKPENYGDQNRVAGIGVDALTAVYGTTYKYGSTFDVIYQASGITIDWAYSAGIPYAYTPELRDTGKYGFLLPEDQIIPTATEFWEGLFAADIEM